MAAVVYNGIMIITVHLALWRLLPIIVQQWIPLGLVEIIPTADGRLNLGFIITFVIIAPIILTILAGGPRKIGLVWRKDALRWAAAGTGLQLVIYPLINLVQGENRISSASAMGVTTPEQFVFYTLITAWVVDGFREELYYRGFVQCLMGKILPGPWRLLLPALFFSFAHININGTMIDWIAGALPHILPGLIFGMLVIKSDSLIPSMLAHGAGNAAITGLTGIYVYAPGYYLAAVLITCLIGAAMLLWQWDKLSILFNGLRSEFKGWSLNNLNQGITLIVLLFAGYVLIMYFWPHPYILLDKS